MYKRSVCMNERVGAPPDMPFPTRMLDRDRCTNYVERARTYQAKPNMFYFIYCNCYLSCRLCPMPSSVHTTHSQLTATAVCYCFAELRSPSSKSHRANFIHGSVLDLDDRTVTVALKFHSSSAIRCVRCVGFGFMFRAASPRHRRRKRQFTRK